MLLMFTRDDTRRNLINAHAIERTTSTTLLPSGDDLFDINESQESRRSSAPAAEIRILLQEDNDMVMID